MPDTFDRWAFPTDLQLNDIAFTLGYRAFFRRPQSPTLSGAKVVSCEIEASAEATRYHVTIIDAEGGGYLVACDNLHRTGICFRVSRLKDLVPQYLSEKIPGGNARTAAALSMILTQAHDLFDEFRRETAAL